MAQEEGDWLSPKRRAAVILRSSSSLPLRRRSREPPLIRVFFKGSSCPTKKKRPFGCSCGAGRGIRTPVGFPPNGFQDRLVMTASIRLHIRFHYYTLLKKLCQSFFLPLTKTLAIKKRARKVFSFLRSFFLIRKV